MPPIPPSGFNIGSISNIIIWCPCLVNPTRMQICMHNECVSLGCVHPNGNLMFSNDPKIIIACRMGPLLDGIPLKGGPPPIQHAAACRMVLPDGIPLKGGPPPIQHAAACRMGPLPDGIPPKGKSAAGTAAARLLGGSAHLTLGFGSAAWRWRSERSERSFV